MRFAPRQPSIRRALFRLGLRAFENGWLRGAFGVRWVRVETRGRTSGQAHVVLLDVIGEEAASGTVYVQPARGRRADWFRNVRRTPHVRYDLGERGGPASVRELSREEADPVLAGWVRSHPRYATFVAKRLGWSGNEAAGAWLALSFPVVAITPEV